MANSNKKKKHPQVSGFFFEQIRETAGSAATTAKKDLLEETTKATLQQVFGTPQRGELKEGQVLDLKKEKKEELQRSHLELKRRETLLFVREQEVAQEVEAARAELKKAVKELKKLGQDVFQIEKAAQKMPVKPGIYHLTFFERLRQIIRFFRERIEESRTWLKMMTSKKKKKGYWAKFKKHGTKFALSGERAVATQVG